MVEKAKTPSDGFFLAKRQMQDTLDRKICDLRVKKRKLEKSNRYADIPALTMQIDLIEDLRNYVRNGMLWDTRSGK